MSTMKAMVLVKPREALQALTIPRPCPGPDEVLVKVSACAVCRTDLHVIDGELPNPKLPLIPGHEIVGRIVKRGSAVENFRIDDRVGIPWLGWACGQCRFCLSHQENLCERGLFTGYTRDGGYAEYTVADARFCFRIPDGYSDAEAAPLLCAGLIGFRCFKKCGDARRIGVLGFGAAAHLLTQIARFAGRKIFAFTRRGDTTAQEFARDMGAIWAGGSDELPPERLDAAIVFAPDGDLVPVALRLLERGGCVVCGGIHMSDIPTFAYRDLWHERSISSVANLTRSDGAEFFRLVAETHVHTEVKRFPLAAANAALAQLREGMLRGAAVLVI
jgi:propanol-preferring alcohol dehydrogenase